MGCAVCDESIATAIRRGHPPLTQPGGFIPQNPNKAGEYYEGTCAGCGVSGRTRAVATLLLRGAPFIRRSAPVLVAAGGPQQLPLYRRYFSAITHVSLHGDHGDADCIVGVDINDLSRFSGRTFVYFFAVCVLDYIETPWLVFREVRRVLKRGGTAFFFIMPPRIGDFAELVRVRNRNALKNEPYSPKLDDGTTGTPDCQFDRKSLLRWMGEAGMMAETVIEHDHISKLRFEFFVGRA